MLAVLYLEQLKVLMTLRRVADCSHRGLMGLVMGLVGGYLQHIGRVNGRQMAD